MCTKFEIDTYTYNKVSKFHIILAMIYQHAWEDGFDFIECFTTTFLRAHSWLNWVDMGGWGMVGNERVNGLDYIRGWKLIPTILNTMMSMFTICTLTWIPCSKLVMTLCIINEQMGGK